MMMKNRSNYFALMSYCSLSDINRFYRIFADKIVGIVTILHDKDTDEATGKPVEPHRHIVIKTVGFHTSSAVLKWFNRLHFVDNSGKDVNTFIEDVFDVNCILEYLVHLNHPLKYQYSVDAVQCYGVVSWYKCAGRSKDDSYCILIDFDNKEVSLRDMARIYGRDFVLNFRRYAEFYQLLKIEQDVDKSCAIDSNSN